MAKLNERQFKPLDAIFSKGCHHLRLFPLFGLTASIDGVFRHFLLTAAAHSISIRPQVVMQAIRWPLPNVVLRLGFHEMGRDRPSNVSSTAPFTFSRNSSEANAILDRELAPGLPQKTHRKPLHDILQ